MQKLKVRFNKTMHVIGWYGVSTSSAKQQAIDFVNANINRRNRKAKTKNNLSARDKAMSELKF